MEHRIKAFKNANQFQQLFGKTEHGTRKNGILLAFLKHRPVWDWCKKHKDWSALAVNSMATLKMFVLNELKREQSDLHFCEGELHYYVYLNGAQWFSNDYCTDDHKGICLDTEETEDGTNFIRYINMSTNKPFKMKAGKFYKRLFEPCDFWKALPQQVQVWMLEELVKDWKTYVTDKLNQYDLRVSKDFGRIYDSYHCVGDFCSCMTDEGQHVFYEDSVDDAWAAYLEDKNGYIVARCIVFNRVYDEDGNVWKLAERQYSTDGNELLKQMLVNSLIKGGHIDGYKSVGAGCGDSTAFVDNNGNSISDKDFYIRLSLEHGDTLSYQDSFKYYMPDECRAYNHDIGCEEDDRLDTTDREFYGSYHEWDDYHGRYCQQIENVWRHGWETTCDADDLDDFVWYNGRYYYEDDVLECPRCGCQYLDPEHYGDEDTYHSSLLDEDYCSEECLDEAENEFKEENWFRADLEEDYVEDKSLLATYLALVGNKYIVQTFLKKRLNRYLKLKTLYIYNGVIVDDLSKVLQDDRICEEFERVNIELSKAE